MEVPDADPPCGHTAAVLLAASRGGRRALYGEHRAAHAGRDPFLRPSITGSGRDRGAAHTYRGHGGALYSRDAQRAAAGALLCGRLLARLRGVGGGAAVAGSGGGGGSAGHAGPPMPDRLAASAAALVPVPAQANPLDDAWGAPPPGSAQARTEAVASAPSGVRKESRAQPDPQADAQAASGGAAAGAQPDLGAEPHGRASVPPSPLCRPDHLLLRDRAPS